MIGHTKAEGWNYFRNYNVMVVKNMTVQEIKAYLKKHFFLVFKYHSEYYSLKRGQSLFCSQYCLVATDSLLHWRNSLEELCEQVYMSDGTLLIEAIKYMEIPELDDPSWKTYGAVRHSAIVYENEIHFSYNGKGYWIAHTSDGLSHLSDDLGNTQMFDSCRDLFENARIDGSTLEEIWGKVIVDSC